MFSSKWIICPHENPNARIRLFCFPYAGSGISVYHSWYEKLSAEIELCMVKLPGRETRFNEAPYRRLPELIKKLSPAISIFFDKPFMFFGHSLGAHICFYLTRYLKENSQPHPEHIFISAARAPHLPELPHSLNYEMDEEAFIDKLKEFGGMVDEVLQNRELLDLVLPVLRADIEMLNTMKYTKGTPLECSITSIYGELDERANREDSEAWKKHTSKAFNLEKTEGKHLFINTHQDQVIDIINRVAA